MYIVDIQIAFYYLGLVPKNIFIQTHQDTFSSYRFSKNSNKSTHHNVINENLRG